MVNHWTTQTLLTPQQREQTRKRLENSWRQVLVPPTNVSVSEWAEANIILSRDSESRGSLHLDKTPYLREIINQYLNPNVKIVTLCFGTQCAKTTALLLVLGYTIAEDPAPIIFALSTGDLAKTVATERVDPLIDACPVLRRLKRTGKDDYTTLIKRFETCTLTMLGAQSPRQAKSRPTKLLLLDEIQDYKHHTESQASVLHQLRDRTKAWTGSKIYQSGTPRMETEAVWQAFQEGNQSYFYVPCPHDGCHEPQRLQLAQVKWDQDAKRLDGSWDIEAVKASAYYECIHCHGRIEDKHKQEMLIKGRWRADKPEVRSHLSYHLSSLYPVWISFGRVAEAFLLAKDHPSSLKDFRSEWLGECWTINYRANQQDRLTSKCGTYKAGTIPGPDVPVALVLTVDVQADCCWFVVRAWCAGETSYLVECGNIPSLEHLKELSGRIYDGYRITHVFVDHGYRGTYVESICVPNKFHMTKGFQNMRQVFEWGRTATGHHLLNLDKTQLSDALADKMDQPLGKTGSWYLFENVSDEYLLQMSSEQCETVKDARGFPKRVWRKIHEKGNHYWDCEVYQLGIAIALGCRNASPPSPRPIVPKQQEPQKKPQEPVRSLTRPDGRSFYDIGRPRH